MPSWKTIFSYQKLFSVLTLTCKEFQASISVLSTMKISIIIQNNIYFHTQGTEIDYSITDGIKLYDNFPIDHPFIIVIINENVKTIVFIGHYQGASWSVAQSESLWENVCNSVNYVIKIVIDFGHRSLKRVLKEIKN